MKKVLVFIESLDGGGAEAILRNTVSVIDKSKFDITVVTETDNERYTDEVRSYVHHRSFTKRNGSVLNDIVNKVIIKYSLLASEKAVRNNLIKGDYDVEIAFCEGYATKVVGNSGRKNCRKIAWVHTDVINHPWSEAVHGGAENERKCYENFDAIVCVSETMKESFVKKYGMAEKVHVVYNVIDDEETRRKSEESVSLDLPRPIFALAGRLTQVKGYDRLVRICAKLRDMGYDFSVAVLGKGEEEENIKKLISENSLDERIKLFGFQENPHKFIKNSDVFVCSSYAEGYSTAVSEAVILGVPVITTECSGMREIFGGEDCGVICENSDEALFEAMKKVLDEPSLLEFYKEGEKKRAESFSMASRIRVVEDFIENI